MINPWTERGRIKASYRPNGRLEIRDLGPAPYCAFSKDPSHLLGAIEVAKAEPGWYRGDYADYDSRKTALEANPSWLYEADVSPTRRFLTDNYCKIDPPKRCYVDLETDSRTPFSQAVLGHTVLLCWALVDEEGHRKTGVLDGLDDEAELWGDLWEAIADYDQVAAWNGSRFDFEVLENRSKLLLPLSTRLRDLYYANRRRLLFVDQLLCFKRHHMAMDSGDDKTSMRLNDVCEAILKEGKHDFDSGKTWDAWIAGGESRKSLVEYCLQDTDLLRKLEEATGYLALQQSIAEVTLTPVNTHTLKPSPWIDAYLLKMAHKRGTHLPSKREFEGEAESFEGAFVMETKRSGILRSVHVCDFKSLYPSLIRTFNVGHETKGLPGATAFGTNVTFGTDEESMLAAMCREFMSLRDEWKQKMKEHPPGTDAWKDAERRSKAYKIANNSAYGVLGNPYFRLYDVQLAESITLSAQHLIKATIAKAEGEGLEPIAGDTDSVFIAGGTVEAFSDFVERCNRDLYPPILQEAGCRLEQQCISLAYEKCFDRLIIPMSPDGKPPAKKYAGRYLHYAGKAATADSRPEIKGLEFMRGDSVRFARSMQKELIDKLLAGQEDPEFFEEWVKLRRQEVAETDLRSDDIVLTKGISRDIVNYVTIGPHVRVAKELASRGEDVGEGTRISYIIVDGDKSPAEVIPASDYVGKFDRRTYWNKMIYPPSMRLLVGAFPDRNWKRWLISRPKKVLPGQLGLPL